MLVSPGDNVLVESPTYSGALASVIIFFVDLLVIIRVVQLHKHASDIVYAT